MREDEKDAGAAGFDFVALGCAGQEVSIWQLDSKFLTWVVVNGFRPRRFWLKWKAGILCLAYVPVMISQALERGRS